MQAVSRAGQYQGLGSRGPRPAAQPHPTTQANTAGGTQHGGGPLLLLSPTLPLVGTGRIQRWGAEALLPRPCDTPRAGGPAQLQREDSMDMQKGHRMLEDSEVTELGRGSGTEVISFHFDPIYIQVYLKLATLKLVYMQ